MMNLGQKCLLKPSQLGICSTHFQGARWYFNERIRGYLRNPDLYCCSCGANRKDLMNNKSRVENFLSNLDHKYLQSRAQKWKELPARSTIVDTPPSQKSRGNFFKASSTFTNPDKSSNIHKNDDPPVHSHRVVEFYNDFAFVPCGRGFLYQNDSIFESIPKEATYRHLFVPPTPQDYGITKDDLSQLELTGIELSVSAQTSCTNFMCQKCVAIYSDCYLIDNLDRFDPKPKNPKRTFDEHLGVYRWPTNFGEQIAFRCTSCRKYPWTRKIVFPTLKETRYPLSFRGYPPENETIKLKIPKTPIQQREKLDTTFASLIHPKSKRNSKYWEKWTEYTGTTKIQTRGGSPSNDNGVEKTPSPSKTPSIPTKIQSPSPLAEEEEEDMTTISILVKSDDEIKPWIPNIVSNIHPSNNVSFFFCDTRARMNRLVQRYWDMFEETNTKKPEQEI